MASGVFDDLLIRHLWSTDELRAIFNERNRVQKWLNFEAVLALEQAAAAHALMESSAHMGKLVLDVCGDRAQ